MLAAGFVAALGSTAHAAGDYRDLNLSFEERAKLYLAAMNDNEKYAQIGYMSPAIPRLGIPGVNWWSEAAHGVARAQRATVYPDPIAMAASWDPALLKQVAVATADEARVKYSEVKNSADLRSQWYHGIILWSPTINMARDPRWGRVEETYGEDPYLTSQLGIAFCQGVQGDDPKYLKTIATPKHFAMHSQETGRTNSSFDASEKVLHEYYLPAFEACLHEGGAMSIMASHNGINRVPNAVNNWLLNDVLRKDWQFQGAVVTDYRELEYLVQAHRVAPTAADAAAMAINAGVDILSEDRGVPEAVQNAVLTGKLKMATLDQAIYRGLLCKLKLGLMDPPEKVPFNKIPASVVGSPAHVELARKMSAEGTVLLKNDEMPRGYGMGKLLPLDLRKISSVAVLGQYATQTQLGTYIAGMTTGFGTTQYTAGPIANPYPSIQSQMGERIIVRNELFQDVEACEKAAADSDVTIVVLGISNNIENEGVDRPNLSLPLEQQRFIERIVRVNPATVVVLQGGSSIACGWLKEHVPAIMMMWYAGEQGGNALADVLLGRANPAG
ncbi:MAG TPA: glycoside hydrolase family 3 N-terminal domain-containing protein, partial [Phycisphaerae bacterium]|nr:glycoside hydrolase family 3 N-terminal domain-containing protein [Phycisphaerae bacterium]